jgi:putative transposase
MSHTHSCLLYHLVFNTKRREPWLEPNIRTQVFSYLAGILQEMDGAPILINGVSDHVHILTGLRSRHCLADVLRDLKSSSSRWFQETFKRTAFAWQEGYGAFTVSPNQKDSAIAYIRNQEEHHRETSFQAEYLRMLKLAEIEYDPKFVFN